MNASPRTDETRPPLRILLVEDQTIMRDVLGEWLDADPRWKLVGSLATVAEARERISRGDVDLVVLDVQLPDGSGLELATGASGPKIVLITAHEQPWILRDASRAAVLGIVMKGAPLTDLRRAIDKAAVGEPSVCRRTAELMRTKNVRTSPHELITPREIEILKLVAEGCTSREIARKLGIREKTVQNHRANLMKKLDLDDVPSLVRYAIAHGVTELKG